jgi:hypothetical protein
LESQDLHLVDQQVILQLLLNDIEDFLLAFLLIPELLQVIKEEDENTI